MPADLERLLLLGLRSLLRGTIVRGRGRSLRPVSATVSCRNAEDEESASVKGAATYATIVSA